MTTAPLVLNVNDQVAHLYMVSKMLRSAGFRVLEARSGRDALAMAAAGAERPAVVVLDVRLPDMSGFEVCRRLKGDPATRDIKVVHTSATFVSSGHKLEGVEAGADGYLSQPFEPQELIATVQSLVRLHATESDLVARNEALVAADRRKDEFLAMLAHELRNPLAAIATGLPLLERFPARDAVEERTLILMRRQTTLLIRLVDDLLDVSRVTRGKVELRLEPVDLAALVRQVSDGIRARLYDARQQALVVAAPSTPLVVAGDPARLEQILTNLLDNASKYSPSGTRVDVSLARDDGRAVLVVRDQGIGIDGTTLPSVFELFMQAHTSLSRSHGGLGIGLTLVKGLVALHGGDIAAHSDGAGRGTTITVRLPCTAAPARRVAPPPRPTRAGYRVLVVDDNADGREVLGLLCTMRGLRVLEASDGLAGVDRAIAERPELALVDIGLPEIDGYEVARRIRAALGDSIRLIALSGYGSPEHREAALAAGFDMHFAKPLEEAQLGRVLELVESRA